MTVSKSETEKLGTKIPFLGNWWKVEIGWITFGVFPSEDLVAWCRPVCLGTYLLALNTRFDSLDLDFHFFFKTQPPRLIPVKGGFFRLFSVQKFVFQGHMIKKRGAWRRIWIPFWMLDYRILSLTQSLGTKKMAPPQKRGDETWGTKRLEVSDLMDNWWWQKILEILKESWPFHSHLIDVTMLVVSSAPRTVTPQKSHRRSGVENWFSTLREVIDSHGTMIHGAPWCVFAARSHSQHWNWSPNLQPWSWKLTAYWVAWCSRGLLPLR